MKRRKALFRELHDFKVEKALSAEKEKEVTGKLWQATKGMAALSGNAYRISAEKEGFLAAYRAKAAKHAHPEQKSSLRADIKKSYAADVVVAECSGHNDDKVVSWDSLGSPEAVIRKQSYLVKGKNDLYDFPELDISYREESMSSAFSDDSHGET